VFPQTYSVIPPTNSHLFRSPALPPSPCAQPKSTEITASAPIPFEAESNLQLCRRHCLTDPITLIVAKANFPLVYGCWSVHPNNLTHVISGGIPIITSNKPSLLVPFTYSKGTLARSGILNISHNGDNPCSEAELEASLNPFSARYYMRCHLNGSSSQITHILIGAVGSQTHSPFKS